VLCLWATPPTCCTVYSFSVPGVDWLTGPLPSLRNQDTEERRYHSLLALLTLSQHGVHRRQPMLQGWAQAEFLKPPTCNSVFILHRPYSSLTFYLPSSNASLPADSCNHLLTAVLAPRVWSVLHIAFGLSPIYSIPLILLFPSTKDITGFLRPAEYQHHSLVSRPTAIWPLSTVPIACPAAASGEVWAVVKVVHTEHSNSSFPGGTGTLMHCCGGMQNGTAAVKTV
jgi:hypothetical protein